MKLPKGIKFDKIRLDSEGIWLHEDVEITHKRTLEMLFKSIYADKGKFYLKGEKFPVPIQVDDAAFFVREISKKNGGFDIKLSDGSCENLDISSLDVGSNNALYCKIKDRAYLAKFERKVYYELMKFLTVKDGYYGLLIDKIFYPVQSVEQAKQAKSDHEVAAKKAAQKKIAKKKPVKKTVVKKKKVVKKKSVKKKVTKKKPVKKKPVKKKISKKTTVKKKAVKKKTSKKKTSKKKISKKKSVAKKKAVKKKPAKKKASSKKTSKRKKK